MGRLIAIGGGTYEEIDDFNRIAAQMTGKSLPNALFIGTALQDSTNPLTSFKKSFKRACPGAQVKKLSIIRSTYTDDEMNALFSWADVIFIGGGNTAYMLDEWKKAGLDKKLRNVYEEDTAVLAGISAGAICWFKKGYTDSAAFTGTSDWDYQVMDLPFCFYDAFFCPHYNDPKRSGFDEKAAGLHMRAVALEDCTAFIDDHGRITYRSLDPARHAYEIDPDGRKIQMC